MRSTTRKYGKASKVYCENTAVRKPSAEQVAMTDARTVSGLLATELLSSMVVGPVQLVTSN